jgi:hypothetical protein
MHLNTACVGASVAPTVISTWFSHVRSNSPSYVPTIAEPHITVSRPQISSPEANCTCILRRRSARRSCFPQTCCRPYHRRYPGVHCSESSHIALGQDQGRRRPGRVSHQGRRQHQFAIGGARDNSSRWKDVVAMAWPRKRFTI